MLVRWVLRGWGWGSTSVTASSLPTVGLAYCRHLSTVRTHLSALVHHNIIPPDRPPGASGGLTKDVWSKYQKDKKVQMGLQGRGHGWDLGGNGDTWWPVVNWMFICRKTQ